MFQILVKRSHSRDRVGLAEIAQDTLAPGRVAHDDKLVVFPIFCRFVAFDVLCALGNLLRISVKVPQAPLGVRRREAECEE